ncbi:MAG: DUF1330 domain-containing protein [Pseudomonadota bacterium]
MKYYVVAMIDMTEPDWFEEYAQKVTPIVESVGGRFLTRTKEFVCLEGQRQEDQLIVILQFPSQSIAVDFFDSEAYRPFRKVRRSGSPGTVFLMPGKDDANQASI